MTSNFRHIDEAGFFLDPALCLRIVESQGSPEPMASTVFDVAQLVEAAAAFFVGIYPVEAPYFYWGKSYSLPWVDEYTNPGGEVRSPPAMEVAAIFEELAEVRKREGISRQATYSSEHLCSSPMLKVQGLAVEVMTAADQVFDDLMQSRLGMALASLSEAYQALSELTVQAERLIEGQAIAANAAAKVLSKLGNTARHAKLAPVRAWALSEFLSGKWGSAYQASFALVEQALEMSKAQGAPLSPQQAQRTLYGWLKTTDRGTASPGRQ